MLKTKKRLKRDKNVYHIPRNGDSDTVRMTDESLKYVK